MTNGKEIKKKKKGKSEITGAKTKTLVMFKKVQLTN